MGGFLRSPRALRGDLRGARPLGRGPDRRGDSRRSAAAPPADRGAEVIKVERTVTLDLGERRGGFYGNLNRGKQSLILNMSKPGGVKLAKRLAATCDVVVDNFSARVMGNWGLDYAGLRVLRPDVIVI